MTSQSAAAETATCTRTIYPARFFALAGLSCPAVLAIVGWASANPLYLWFYPVFWCIGVPVADRLLGPAAVHAVDTTDPVDTHDAGPPWLVRAAIPVAYIDVIVLMAYIAQPGAPAHTLVAAGASLAIVIATVVMNVRHLIPAHDPIDNALAVLATGLLGAPFYRHAVCVEHQRMCATPADPLTARMGEGYWRYACRALPGVAGLAWRQMQKRTAQSPSWRRLIASGGCAEMLGTVALYGLLIAWAGVAGGVVVFIAWTGAVGIVLGTHYVQHYGLLRDKRRDGEYGRISVRHAWDDPHLVSGSLLFNATCHAHAHIRPRCHCANLRPLESAPQLPCAYPAAIALALVPQAWFAVMDPCVARWAEGDMQRVNIDGDAYATLMARYHRPKAT